MKCLTRLFGKYSRPNRRLTIRRSKEIELRSLATKQSWGLIRNEYYKAAQDAEKDNNLLAALQLLALVIYLDRNGATNIDMSDKDLRQLGFSRWDTETSYFNKNVSTQFVNLLRELNYSEAHFGVAFFELCNENIIRYASVIPPYSPQTVWAAFLPFIEQHLISSPTNKRKQQYRK
jgi:hypothetical protein